MTSTDAVEAAVSFLRKLDPATQREVLERFEEVLQLELPSVQGRLRRVAVALHQAKRELGRTPSVREYRQLRAEHPQNDWPEVRCVTRWLGVRSWNEAMVRMRLEPVSAGDSIEEPKGPAYTVDDALRAIRACTLDLGHPPTVSDYLAWVRRPDVSAREGRRPAGPAPFDRLFGGFAAARVAAGVVGHDPSAALPDHGLIRPATNGVTESEAVEHLRLVATRIEAPFSMSAYVRQRRLIYNETSATGNPVALVGIHTMYRLFGSWPSALKTAGLASIPRDRRILRYTTEVLSAALAEAARQADERLTARAYLRWRANELERNPIRRNELPHAGTIDHHFGSWQTALETAAPQIASRPRWGPRITTDYLLEALAEAARSTDGHLGVIKYAAWRTRELIRNPNRSIPSHATITYRFGTWSKALEAADPVAAARPRRNLQIKTEALLRVLSEAESNADGHLSIAKYNAWRTRELNRNPGRQLPPTTAFKNRFGSWLCALEQLHKARASSKRETKRNR